MVWKALTRARSITGRLFTAADQAEHHCGIGNMGLVVQVMVDWLDEKTGQAGSVGETPRNRVAVA